MVERQPEWADPSSCRNNLLLEIGKSPLFPALKLDRLDQVANLVLDRSVLGLVRGARNAKEASRPRTTLDRLQHKCGEVQVQVVPDKDLEVVRLIVPVLFYVQQDVVRKIGKMSNSCASVMDDADPSARTLDTSVNVIGQVRVSWLNGK